MGDKKCLDREEHLKFMRRILAFFIKIIDNVFCLVVDNVSNNKQVSRIANVPFVGSASPRYSITVMGIFVDQKSLID